MKWCPYCPRTFHEHAGLPPAADRLDEHVRDEHQDEGPPEAWSPTNLP